LKNKFLFNGYYNDLLKLNDNGGIVFFCELNSFNSSILRNLKKDLKKNNFLVRNVKTRLVKLCFNNKIVNKLIFGPLFFIYKDFLDQEKDIKVLQKFHGYNFILGCMFNNKFYLFSKLKQFKNIVSIEQFFNTIIFILNSLLFINYSYLKKIGSE
jgi:ribosomal protein L10